MPAPEENPQQPSQPQQPANTQTPTIPAINNSATTLIDGIINVTASETQIQTTEEYLKNYQNNRELIPFSLGLDNLQVSSPGGGGNTVADVNLSGELTGYWVSDPSLKQFGAEMTVFQSFPVKVAGDKYTSIIDHTSTVDGAGTNLGELCIGTLGYPDGFDPKVLTKVAGNTKGGGFKVGASIYNKLGVEYLNHYYPEIGFTINHFNKMRQACILNAEVVIPTSGVSGKAFRIKIVDEGPHPPYCYSSKGLWKIDIIGAFCMLTENQSLFNIYGKNASGSVPIDNVNYVFPFKDAKYDILTGEISGYTPEAILEIIDKNQVHENKKIFSSYFGNPVGSGAVRVKFYIEPAHRSQAEKIVGKPLPDDFFKTNGNYVAGLNSSAIVPQDGSIGALIRQAAIMVGNYCNTNNINYGSIGGYIKRPDGLVIGSGRNIDCASGINCILATAGIFTYSPGEYYGNTAWWRSGGHLSKISPGYTATKVFAGDTIPKDILQPGDIILYDRGRPYDNHLSLYMGPGERADFGNPDSARSIQPLASNIRMTRGKNDVQLVVWRFSKVAENYV